MTLTVYKDDMSTLGPWPSFAFNPTFKGKWTVLFSLMFGSGRYLSFSYLGKTEDCRVKKTTFVSTISLSQYVVCKCIYQFTLFFDTHITKVKCKMLLFARWWHKKHIIRGNICQFFFLGGGAKSNVRNFNINICRGGGRGYIRRNKNLLSFYWSKKICPPRKIKHSLWNSCFVVFFLFCTRKSVFLTCTHPPNKSIIFSPPP